MVVGGVVAATTLVVGASPASAAGASAAAPLALGAAGCVESFDGLAAGTTGASLPPGAGFDETGTSARADGAYSADNGASNAGDVYSLGATGSTERAFGSLLSSSLTPTLGVVVRNDTSATLTSLGITYSLEQWRQGGTGRFDKLLFSYSSTTAAVTGGTYTSVAALDGTAPNGGATTGALDGNLAANRASISGMLTGLSVAPGASVLLRWSDLNAAGSDDSLGIDDLALAPNGAAAPTTLCSTPGGGGGGGGGGGTKIHDIQGSGAVSPSAGQSAAVDGIVIGLDDQIGSSFGTGNAINTFPTDRGFFLQEEDADADADPATSEGIFVGLPSASTSLPQIGDRVSLTGTVKDGQSPPAFGQTRIEPSTYTIVSSGNALPTATVLDATKSGAQTIGSEANPTRSYYETVEGMRVTLPVGVANSGGTNKFGETFLVPGTVAGTLLRTDAPAPGLIASSAEAGAGNPPNPKHPSTPSSTELGMDKGDIVNGLTGPLAYSFGNYEIVPQIGQLPTITESGVAYPYAGLAAAGADQRRIVSFNLENFFPEGGALDGTIINAAEFQLKRDQAADAIGRVLHAPDVVAVMEIGDNQHLGQSGTTSSLGTLQALAVRLGQLGHGSYTAYGLEGNDNRGIDVGYLVKSTVTVLGAADQRGGLTVAGTCSDVSGRLFDRPPLFLHVDLGPAIGSPWLVANHFASKAAPDSCRVAQAAWVRDQVKALETAGQQVIVMGDLNAFEDEGALTTLQDGQTTLHNLWSAVPHGEAYSFQFDGVLQTLDHVLVTSGLTPAVSGFQYAHLDNDYFQRAAQPDGHGVSDHDPPVLTLGLTQPPTDVPEAPIPAMLVGSGLLAMLLVSRKRRSAVG